MTTRARTALLISIVSMVGSLAVTTQASFAAAQRVIAANHEGQVLALFAPAGLGDEVVPGYRLMDVSIRATDVVVTLVGADESPLVLRLAASDEPLGEGTQVAETPSFRVVSAVSLEGVARGTAEALAERIRSNDDGDFWDEVTTGAPPSNDGHVALGVVAGLVVVFAVGLLVRRARSRKRRASGSPTDSTEA
ncbi:MAG: hypothetical protein R3B40_22855 [Polyangiales bacterium]|nr:hypothetical protein [Myxococcales bacterium]MCB9659481.1 hypothetical protein [Sandaracinaceae bacterium]